MIHPGRVDVGRAVPRPDGAGRGESWFALVFRQSGGRCVGSPQPGTDPVRRMAVCRINREYRSGRVSSGFADGAPSSPDESRRYPDRRSLFAHIWTYRVTPTSVGRRQRTAAVTRPFHRLELAYRTGRRVRRPNRSRTHHQLASERQYDHRRQRIEPSRRTGEKGRFLAHPDATRGLPVEAHRTARFIGYCMLSYVIVRLGRPVPSMDW